MIMCSTLGEKYGLLPSQVSEIGTIFDLMCFDVASTWSQYHMSDSAGRAKMMNTYSDANDLKKIMEAARNGNNNKK